MNLRTHKTCLIAGILVATGCGPMNAKPAAAIAGRDANGHGAGQNPDPTGSAIFTTNQLLFVVSAQLDGMQGDGNPQNPRTGRVVLRVVHGKSLDAVSPDTQLTLTYLRVTDRAATHDPFPLAVTRQADGTFTAPLSMKKTGPYNFHVTLSEGSTQDEQSFTLQI